jgi:hypothetical protein
MKRSAVVGLGASKWTDCGIGSCASGGDCVTLVVENSVLDFPSFDRLTRLLPVKSKSSGYCADGSLGSRGERVIKLLPWLACIFSSSSSSSLDVGEGTRNVLFVENFCGKGSSKLNLGTCADPKVFVV